MNKIGMGFEGQCSSKLMSEDLAITITIAVVD